MDLLKAFGPLLGEIAPTLATALGGPLAGVATKTISDALLGKTTGSVREIAEALSGATPEQLAELRKTDAAFKTRMAELEIDLERISADDRDSARKREMEVKDWTPTMLAAGITFGFFGVLFWLFVYGVPKGSGDVVMIMLGGLQTSFVAVVSYYFGSSASSKAKDILIARGR